MDVTVPATTRTWRKVEPDAMRQRMTSLLALIMRLVDERGAVIVHMTATRHGEGTTTVARELASVAAQSKWCKVALINTQQPVANGSHPPVVVRGVVQTFGVAKDLQLRWIESGAPDLPMGALNWPGEFSPKIESVRALYSWLREKYTLVIVDSPPILPSSEAAVAASVADGVILVVEADHTRVADIERARETLYQMGATILGVVLNKRAPMPDFIERLA